MKYELDHKVAALTGVPYETVRLVTAEFLSAIKNAIIDGEDVLLREFGGFHYRAIAQKARTLRDATIPACSRFVVAFRASPSIRHGLRERYGKDHVH